MKKIFAIVLTLALTLATCACAEGTIKIAVAGPMTGDNAEYGIGFANAAKLMASQWNEEKGGVTIGDETYTIEIVEYDDKSDSDEAAIIAENIVSDEDIWGVIGHFASGICMVAAPTYQDAEYINISPTSSHADYSSIGDYIFRNNTVIDVETYTGAEMAVKDLGGTCIGVLSSTPNGVSPRATPWRRTLPSWAATSRCARRFPPKPWTSRRRSPTSKRPAGDVIMVAGMYGTLAPLRGGLR